ncbi:MAG: pseudouridine synthase [Alphaproteobacteria bacterium]|nr:pseudouridine synthase [Alphaproteobacteria bacterium]
MSSKNKIVKPKAATETPPKEGAKEGERIAKRLARAGLCSRREAERWIEAGRVKVDGKILETPACVVTAKSKIEVDDKPLGRAEPTKLWRYHKPKGLLTTNNDPEGRTTIYERLPDTLPRVLSVGRLDLNTEGLLLLTNDGELARHLELPATGWTRRYRVRVHGNVDEKALARLADGAKIEGISYGAIEAKLDTTQRGNSWLSLSLKEGKNREIRRVMEYMELQVTRLIRLSYGPFQLGELVRGDVSAVPKRILKDQLGSHAARFGMMETEGDAKAQKSPRPKKGSPRKKTRT